MSHNISNLSFYNKSPIGHQDDSISPLKVKKRVIDYDSTTTRPSTGMSGPLNLSGHRSDS